MDSQTINNTLQGGDELGFIELVGAYLDGQLTPDELAGLNEQLRNDDACRETFVRYCLQGKLLAEALLAGIPLPTDELPAKTPSPTAAPTFGFLGNATHGTVGYFSHVGPLSYLIATFIMFVMGIAAWSWKLPDHAEYARQLPPLGVERRPDREPQVAFVGRITGMVDCEWTHPDTAAPGTVAVPLGRTYALRSGLMEITYDTGAKVVLQGPCTYEVESRAGGYLSVGKLMAKVEKKAEGGGRRAEEVASLPSPFGRGAGGEGGEKNGNRSESQRALTLALSQGERGPDSVSALRLPPSALFSVRTPTAVVTDLGTEFGVEVDKQGDTMSHVFRGSIKVQTLGGDGTPAGSGQVLHENQSARVEKNSGKQGVDNRVTAFATPAKAADFIREIPKLSIKTLDLVDVVAGGDGFSGRRDRGIDPANGRVTDTPPKLPTRQREEIVNTDGKYHRVEAMPFVDGVFIPDGRTGRVQVDSVGHTFAEFPSTAYQTAGYVWAGGLLLPGAKGLPALPATFNGIDYSAPGHGVLFLHANKGITFDLDAIRRANAGFRPVRFRAVAGNSEPFSSQGERMRRCADVWVLVDGQGRFQRREINGCNGAFPVVIPINDNERFLTVVGTDAGDGVNSDWIMFGDPRLELATKPPIDSAGQE